MSEERDELLRGYRSYDRAVDLVSVFEMWFTQVPEMAATVRHFERFPRYQASDRDEVTPDFTVLFTDDTLLVGELSSLARNRASLLKLVRQVGRYDRLKRAPVGQLGGGGHRLIPVQGVDVLLIMPADVSNYACDRIDEFISDEAESYRPTRRPCVLGWSFDPDQGAYTLKYDNRAGNPRPPSHGRSPSVTQWLEESADTLRGLPKHFQGVKTARRFMNDRPPPIYVATILWLVAFPEIAPNAPPVDIDVSAAEVAGWLQRNAGGGDADMVRSACELLVRAGLAAPIASGWRIGFREIASSGQDVHNELIRRYLMRPRGPATEFDREARHREQRFAQEAEKAEKRDQMTIRDSEETE